jgi:choline-sulfatase
MPDRPNVLMIMCDQLRHDWLGYRGAAPVATPSIDRIAASGRVFTQCCTNSPICAPARIGLATGVRPHRMGALNNHAFLPLSCETYYQRLRDAGYHVGCCGKLDLAKPDDYNGLRGDRPYTYAWGFTDPHEAEGKMHAGRGNPPNGPYTHWLEQQGLLETFCSDAMERRGGCAKVLRPSPLPVEAFEDVYIGRTSCRMLRQMPGDFPWHFFVSFVGPHNPFDPPAEFYDRYADVPMPPAIAHEPEGRPARYGYKDPVPSEQDILTCRRLYSAYVELIDEQIGRIMQTLEDMGQADRTYVVFTADHGEMLGDHGRWTKGCHYESSLRIPLVVAGPGIPPGSSDALVELNDLAPTICGWTQTALTTEHDALDLGPVLAGESDEHREYTFATLPGTWSVRTREWKLIGGSGGEELYHLADDGEERRNVADQHPDVVDRLARIYASEWAGRPGR